MKKYISLEHAIRKAVAEQNYKKKALDESISPVDYDKPKEVPQAFFKPVHVQPRKGEDQIPAGGPVRSRRNLEKEKSSETMHPNLKEEEQLNELLDKVAVQALQKISPEAAKETIKKVVPKAKDTVTSVANVLRRMFSPGEPETLPKPDEKPEEEKPEEEKPKPDEKPEEQPKPKEKPKKIPEVPSEPVTVPTPPKITPPAEPEKPKITPPAEPEKPKPVQPPPVEQPPTPGQDPQRKTEPSPTITPPSPANVPGAPNRTQPETPPRVQPGDKPDTKPKTKTEPAPATRTDTQPVPVPVPAASPQPQGQRTPSSRNRTTTPPPRRRFFPSLGSGTETRSEVIFHRSHVPTEYHKPKSRRKAHFEETRYEIKNVARPEDKRDEEIVGRPKSPKSKYTKQAELIRKVFEEQKLILKKEKEEKMGKNPLVDTEPKLKYHTLDQESAK